MLLQRTPGYGSIPRPCPACGNGRGGCSHAITAVCFLPSRRERPRVYGAADVAVGAAAGRGRRRSGRRGRQCRCRGRNAIWHCCGINLVVGHVIVPSSRQKVLRPSNMPASALFWVNARAQHWLVISTAAAGPHHGGGHHTSIVDRCRRSRQALRAVFHDVTR